jgi:methionyl-tRNA synthetase
MNETPKISYDDFAKVEIRAGKIISAEKIPDTDKLLKLMVDFAEYEAVAEGKKSIPKPRQIVSGIAMYFPNPAVLVGRTCMFVTNLEPRMIRGHESNGMLFAVSTPEGAFSLLEPSPIDPSKGAIPPGTRAK